MTGPKKRSVAIRGHRTSFSIEEPFLTELERLARARGITLAALVAEVDGVRAHGVPSMSPPETGRLHRLNGSSFMVIHRKRSDRGAGAGDTVAAHMSGRVPAAKMQRPSAAFLQGVRREEPTLTAKIRAPRGVSETSSGRARRCSPRHGRTR